MRWNELTDISQADQIQKLSQEQHVSAVLIFKHSTRCSISILSLNRLNTKWPDREDVPCYYLDLLNHRDISSKIAEVYGVEHQSPQVLLIKNGRCFYHASHNDISAAALSEALTTQM